MDRGWWRARALGIVGVALVLLAALCQVGETSARAAEPPAHPENPLPLFPSDFRVAAVGLLALQWLLALAGAVTGALALADRATRVLGAAAIAVGVLVVVV